MKYWETKHVQSWKLKSHTFFVPIVLLISDRNLTTLDSLPLIPILCLLHFNIILKNSLHSVFTVTNSYQCLTDSCLTHYHSFLISVPASIFPTSPKPATTPQTPQSEWYSWNGNQHDTALQTNLSHAPRSQKNKVQIPSFGIEGFS